MRDINICENGIYMVLRLLDNGQIKLIHFSALPFHEEDLGPIDLTEGFQLTEINVAGYNRPQEHHGNKMISTTPGYRLLYKDHQDAVNEKGRYLAITEQDAETGIEVTTCMQFYDGIPVVRFQTVVTNVGEATQTIDTLTSFRYGGFEKEGDLTKDEKIHVMFPHNNWQRELNWTSRSLQQMGLDTTQAWPRSQHSSGLFHVTNTGNWSAKEALPLAYIENTETDSSLFFQIEHNGSWHWEISDQNHHLFVSACGPSELYAHWSKELKPGESFTSVPVAAGVSCGGFDSAMAALTRYRRRIRRPNADNENLPVIFNDYMNCLWGDPTTEKELPLIDVAAEAGCEYYVIDCGWYADGDWWDNVGEWKESSIRFPNGLKEVTDYIRSRGMVPGAWLEIEVMGINSPKLKEADGTWFFQRHGRPVYDRSRYQLDFRNPKVVEHADQIIDRLVRDYGIGYIKMDYNIEPGIGTDWQADSPGDGMLGHQRAYLAWLDRVFERFPDLVIENCSSGGLRMDYAMLSRYSIQSTSDQEDYRYYATIAANSPSGLTPEQAAVWSYPLIDGDREEVVFNMVNAMLLRIHQSGHLAEIAPERLALVQEGIKVYRSIREDIKDALPFWPHGLSHFHDEWSALGLQHGKIAYLAVWRREGDEPSCDIQLPGAVSAEQIYPSFEECTAFSLEDEALHVTYKEENRARLYKIGY